MNNLSRSSQNPSHLPHHHAIPVSTDFGDGRIQHLSIRHQTDANRRPGWTERLTALLVEQQSLPQSRRFQSRQVTEMKSCLRCCAVRCAWGVDQDEVVQVAMIALAAKLETWAQSVGIEYIALKLWGVIRQEARIQRRRRMREVSQNEDENLLSQAVDSGQMVCQPPSLEGTNDELKARLASQPKHGRVAVRIVELLEQGYDVCQMATLLGISRKAYYRTFRVLIARHWNALNPEERKEVPLGVA